MNGIPLPLSHLFSLSRYDNHAQLLFPFVEDKVGIPLATRLVYGIERVKAKKHFEADSFSLLQRDLSFNLSTVNEVKALAANLTMMRNLPFVRHPHPFWPER